MKGGTLFSGIGAPEFAAPEIDWRWCAEIDPFASAVHRKRFPTIRNLGDVERINVGSVEPVDVIVFGSPCQSFSIAGRRLGLDDPRGNLALVGLGVVARLRPRWFVFENVPGLLSSDGGRDFGTFLRAVEQCGYGWAYRCLDAQYAGLAQRRNRLFVVGHLGDWRHSAAVLFEPESLRGNPPPRRDAGQGTAAKSLCSTDGGIDREDRHTLIAPPLTAGPKRGGIGRGTDHDLDGGLIAYGGNNTAGALEVATAVRAKGGTGHGDFDSETFVTHTLNTHRAGSATEDGTGRGVPLVAYSIMPMNSGRDYKARAVDVAQPVMAGGPVGGNQGGDLIAYRVYGGNDDTVEGAKEVEAIGAISANNNRVGNSGTHVLLEVADPISAHEADTYSHEGRGNFRLHNCVAVHQNQRAEITTNDTTGALNSGGGKPGQGYPAAQVGSLVRRLMPIECERLQGFPDNYTAIRYRSAPAADGPRYRSLGNSMAVPVIRWVLRRIMKGDE